MLLKSPTGGPTLAHATRENQNGKSGMESALADSRERRRRLAWAYCGVKWDGIERKQGYIVADRRLATGFTSGEGLFIAWRNLNSKWWSTRRILAADDGRKRQSLGAEWDAGSDLDREGELRRARSIACAHPDPSSRRKKRLFKMTIERR